MVSWRCAVTTALLMLGGCGGGSQSGSFGSGGSGATMPTGGGSTAGGGTAPTGGGSTTTPPANTTLNDLKVDQQFDTSSALLQYQQQGTNNILTSSIGAPTAGQYFRFNAADKSYGDYGQPDLNYIAADRTFAPSDIQIAESNAQYSVYYKKSAPRFDNAYLNLLNPSVGNTLIQLNYAGFGSLLYVSDSGTARYEIRPFSYGLTTASSGLPATGSGTYSGVVTGTAVYPAGTYKLTGTVTVNVNFATRIFTATIKLTGTDQARGTVVDIGTFALTPNTPSTFPSFSGSVSGGSYLGSLDGPAAEELGLSFAFLAPDPINPGGTLTLAGAGAAKR